MVGMETVEGTQPFETAQCVCVGRPWMPVQEAAAIIGRSKEFLYAGLREGRFPGVKLGRSRGILSAFVLGFRAEMQAGRPVDLDEYARAWFAKASEGAA